CWGQALVRSGRSAEARAKLNRAAELYTLHGAGSVWLERTQVLEARRPARRYPNGLSEREVGVVRLIAAGMSHRENAQAPLISRNTVERHVNHILAKIGANNRTQVAGYAHRNMLVGA